MGKKSFFGFLYDQLRRVPDVIQTDLKDKTVVVVGANTGIGFQAAQHFAKMNAGRLILACRSEKKGQAAVDRLKAATGYSKAELWLVDLSEFSSVQAFADRTVKDLERLDILLLNAAVLHREDGSYTTTKDGWETTLHVNDLSFTLLSFLLLPLMVDTAKKFNTHPRLVTVTSELHFMTSFEDKIFESPNAIEFMSSKDYCTPQIMKTRYPDTKLLNVFFTRALSNRSKHQPVVFNCVNPGFCRSELLRDAKGMVTKLMSLLLARSAEEGSRQLIWAAIGLPESGSLDEMRGAYINRASIEEPSDFVLGEEGKKREDKLYADTISIIQKVDPRVKEIESQYLI
ncbi:hypothetical protein AGABI1DRAFT_70956 [Agaricus bisporus var. burnettii JB137-S8]|uniref:Uncharacterized protein n=1 Tax=Agaricus bisporus var. burnettii (strain JB137-S8 / ATCC MYA-4627 / FGSC 10392) TaxID=597362 RepID=K5XBE1_AGABU|nr:uncharacterized protein AGABI1DRAFT_70956 [Agaricus bisporus var. burnettii JB137-S8]EKM80573.1 hypothetical protein AGABI1DRAFT_70956 [Agaricus bisporus var. burnettii JB137-S8]